MTKYVKRVVHHPEIGDWHEPATKETGESWSKSKGHGTNISMYNLSSDEPNELGEHDTVGELHMVVGRESTHYQALPPSTASKEASEKWASAQAKKDGQIPLFSYSHFPSIVDVSLDGTKGHGPSNALMLGIGNHILQQETGRTIRDYFSNPGMSLSVHSAPMAEKLLGGRFRGNNDIEETDEAFPIDVSGMKAVSTDEIKAGRNALVSAKRDQKRNLGPQFSVNRDMQMQLPGMESPYNEYEDDGIVDAIVDDQVVDAVPVKRRGRTR